VICGPEAFLRALHTTLARQSLSKAHGQVDVQVFDGSTAKAADVLDECRSFGLIANHKLVLVDQAEQLVKEDSRPLFERYAQSPESGATLILRSHAWKAGKLDDHIEACGAIIRCDPPPESACPSWVVNRAGAAHGVKIALDVAHELVQRVGADLGRLDSELAKLSAAGVDNGEISLELVEEFVGVSREEEAWGVQQSLLGSEFEPALEHLRHVLEVSRQPAPLVQYAVTDLARKLHGLACAKKSGENMQAAARAVKLWGPSQGAVISVAERLHPRATLALLRECVRQDARSKSGFTRPERALDVLAWHVCNTVKR
jgi:DNA polymerase-3 subunit delta